MSPHASFSAPDRITLRDVRPADLDLLFAFQCDPEACAMAMVKPRSRAAFDAIWTKFYSDSTSGIPGMASKVVLVDQTVCGSIGCFPMEGLLCVGYSIARTHWGRGIATRALSLLLSEVPVRPIHARAAASNAASLSVLKKNGFRRTGSKLSPETDRYLACEEVSFIRTD